MTGSKIHHGRAFTSAEQHHGSGQPHHHRRQPGRRPELRFTNTGIAVTNLRVAVTQRIQQDGEWRDGDTSFFKVNVWRVVRSALPRLGE